MSWRVARRLCAYGLAGVAAIVFGSPSCTPIEAPASSAPLNRCSEHPCDRYGQGICNAGRCEIKSSNNARPDYPFWIVVHVPDTAIFAPGSTFVFYSDEKGEPAFKALPLGATSQCRPDGFVRCLKIANLGNVSGEYQVTEEASAKVGFRLRTNTSIPVRVVYTPTGNVQRPTFEDTLPLDVLFDASRLVTEQTSPLQYARALPFGTYERVLYPQPPFDEYFPPTADSQTISANVLFNFVLGKGSPDGKLLDDVSDDSRLAIVTREDGLDGFRVWLEDATTKRRISVVRKLSGKKAQVQLYTTGENRSPTGSGLGDNVQAVIAPPDDWTAVPRYVTSLPGGAGLGNLNYPSIPTPVSVTGVVAFTQPGEGETLRGIPSTLTFESDELSTSIGLSPLLQYQTTVNTDDRGRFATILPPGNYFATIAPNTGSGFAKTRQPVSIDRTVTALTFKPRQSTIVRGRVVLTDERPVGEAEVLAIPETPTSINVPKPRPGRTRTSADGRYVLELDPGPYILSVRPKAGTGFPRVVVHPEIPAEATELPDIRVPPPARLAVVLRDPGPTENAVVRAVVRIFAAIPGREDRPIEIGSGMTGPDGAVEILLAPEPP